MYDLRQLEHFASVFQYKSFKLAAQHLGVSQSAISKSVQSLERHIGLRLFNRTTRQVVPTDTARKLIDHANVVLRAKNAFHNEAQLLAGGDIGALRVATIALASESLVSLAVARLSKSHPQLEIEVIVGSTDIYHDLATGMCDIAIGDEANFAKSPYAESLRIAPIRQERLIFTHRVDHPAAHNASAQILLDYPLAIPSRYYAENQLFESLAQLSDQVLRPQYRLNNINACITLARNSEVLTLIPESMFSESLSSIPSKDKARKRSISKQAYKDLRHINNKKIAQNNLATSGLMPSALQFPTQIALSLVSHASNALTPGQQAFEQAIHQVAHQ